MEQPTTIRRASPGDLPSVIDCAEAAYQHYVPVIGRRPAPMDADFEVLIAAGHAHVAVDVAGRVQGFIVFYTVEDAVLLENVAVAPADAGKGIGKLLIGSCEAAARRSGASRIRLYTNAKMAANLAIYPRLGYRETHRVHEDGFDRVYFEKPL